MMMKVRKFLYPVLTGRTASVNVIIYEDGWNVIVDGVVDAVDGSLLFLFEEERYGNQEKLG